MSGTAAISSIAIIPQGARLHSVSPGHGQALQRIAQVVRPDLVFVDRGEDLGPDDFVIVGGPRLFGDVRDARARGFGQTALLFPEAVTSYYDSWSFPLELIHRSGAGRMTVALPDFERFVMGLSGLFGRFENGIYCHELSRYQAFDRVSNPDKESRLAECLALLADRQSQVSLLAVLKSERIELWRYWLSNLFNGSEYFDVLNIREGDIVMNAGVHGGGEIPHFLARIGDTGRVVNIDPLGDAYLGDFVKTAVLAFAGRCDFVAAALHDEDGALDLPVGASGMAAGGANRRENPGSGDLQLCRALDRLDCCGTGPAARRFDQDGYRRCRAEGACRLAVDDQAVPPAARDLDLPRTRPFPRYSQIPRGFAGELPVLRSQLPLHIERNDSVRRSGRTIACA